MRASLSLVLLLLFCAAVIATRVNVMLPLNAATNYDRNTLKSQMQKLKSGGVDGVMLDVWWGLVEPAPKQYNWGPYQSLLKDIAAIGLKIQCVMSFHQCGGNVGDTVNIPLPKWVLDQATQQGGLLYTDANGRTDAEYLSLGVDEMDVLAGRSPIQVYSDFMMSFAETFKGLLQSGTINNIQIGGGPAGELRYPSYQPAHGWKFPAIGDFQCYDSNMKASLASAADATNPSFNHYPNLITVSGLPSFFQEGTTDNYKSEYGQFFLNWYTGQLVDHGTRVMQAASAAFQSFGTSMSMKVAGVHWFYKTNSHAAEVVTGYKNDDLSGDGYTRIAQALRENGFGLDFTCLEMLDRDQCDICGPEELVNQVIQVAEGAGTVFSGENALFNLSQDAYDKILSYKSHLEAFTFLRLSADLVNDSNWGNFANFVASLSS